MRKTRPTNPLYRFNYSISAHWGIYPTPENCEQNTPHQGMEGDDRGGMLRIAYQRA